MRVIAGSARRMNLVNPSGNDTRPTTDRVKETLFNIIQNRIADCMFLDLFSGSGAIGIEALSRGAGEAVFIENNREALRCIHKNLEHTKFTEMARVLSMDIFAGLKNLENSKLTFDIVFMDPPYFKNMEKKVLEFLQNSSLIDEYTLIIVECSINTAIDYIEDFQYHIERVKTYKTNQQIFLYQK